VADRCAGHFVGQWTDAPVLGDHRRRRWHINYTTWRDWYVDGT